eukprot:gene9762-13133_t
MNSDSNDLIKELRLLDDFVSSLKNDSYLHRKLSAFLNEEKRLNQQLFQNIDNEPFIKYTIVQTGKSGTIKVTSNFTLLNVRDALDSVIGNSNTVVRRIQVPVSGSSFGTFDNRKLIDCGITNEMELLVDVATYSGSNPNNSSSINSNSNKNNSINNNNFNNNNNVNNIDAKGLNRLLQSGISPISNKFELISAAVHCILLDEGFICVTEQPSGVPGFAPALRELPKTQLFPPFWNNDSNTISFMYKHKAKPGKQFLLTCLEMNETLVISLSVRNGESMNIECNLTEVFTAANINNTDYKALFINYELFSEKVKSVVYHFIPSLKPVTVKVSSENDINNQREIGPMLIDPQQPFNNNFINPIVARRTDRDLDPFTNIPGPGPFGGEIFPSPYSGGPLIGPDNPIFNPDGPGYYNPQGYFPQPRHDPFGPMG